MKIMTCGKTQLLLPEVCWEQTALKNYSSKDQTLDQRTIAAGMMKPVTIKKLVMIQETRLLILTSLKMKMNS